MGDAIVFAAYFNVLDVSNDSYKKRRP